MDDNKNTTPVTGTTQPPATNEGGQTKVEIKTFTQDDVNGLIGKTKADLQKKNETAIAEAVANAIAEEQRKAKLSEEEREKENKAKASKELLDRENAITMRERRIEALELMAEKNIPNDLVDFVLDLDLEKVKTNIEKLSKTYSKSIETGITDKLKGNPPTDFGKKNPNDPTKKTISRAF